jgi:hypothetical protein
MPRLSMSRSYTSSPPMCLHGMKRDLKKIEVSEETLEYNKPIFICYVVIEKAFDNLQLKYAFDIL